MIKKYIHTVDVTTSNTKPNNGLFRGVNPWFITGFIDAEGCFSVFIKKNPKFRAGYQVEIRFSIHLHKKDTELLKLLQVYFCGIGKININEKNYSCEFIVSSLNQNIEHIISHFDKYSLITKKQADYLIWKEIINKIQKKEHLKTEGLQSIINLKASLNKGLSEILKTVFPKTIEHVRPEVAESKILHPEWVAGFTSGEGSFIVKIRESKTNKIGFQILLVFAIAQHFRDRQLIKSLISYLRCGGIEDIGSNVQYIVTKFSDNFEKIIPFFSEHKIIGVKSKDFENWCEIAKIIKTGNHLNKKGLDEIRAIKAGMNNRRIIFL